MHHSVFLDRIDRPLRLSDRVGALPICVVDDRAIVKKEILYPVTAIVFNNRNENFLSSFVHPEVPPCDRGERRYRASDPPHPQTRSAPLFDLPIRKFCGLSEGSRFLFLCVNRKAAPIAKGGALETARRMLKRKPSHGGSFNRPLRYEKIAY
jgi:hypothetical protein